jgi:hypothetical protein
MSRLGAIAAAWLLAGCMERGVVSVPQGLPGADAASPPIEAPADAPSAVDAGAASVLDAPAEAGALATAPVAAVDAGAPPAATTGDVPASTTGLVQPGHGSGLEPDVWNPSTAHPAPVTAPTGQVSLGIVTVSKPLDGAELVVRGQLMPRARRCYLGALLSHPTLHGRLQLEAQINGLGEVDSVSASGDLPPALTACVKSILRQAQFARGAVAGPVKLQVRLGFTTP